MNPGGIVLVIAGVLVLTQVLAGDALKRLGIDGSSPDGDDSEFGVTVPDRGYSNVPHNAQGYPL